MLGVCDLAKKYGANNQVVRNILLIGGYRSYLNRVMEQLGLPKSEQ